eukprot:PhM_4_TR10405/c0_g1_i1/m.65915
MGCTCCKPSEASLHAAAAKELRRNLKSASEKTAAPNPLKQHSDATDAEDRALAVAVAPDSKVNIEVVDRGVLPAVCQGTRAPPSYRRARAKRTPNRSRRTSASSSAESPSEVSPSAHSEGLVSSSEGDVSKGSSSPMPISEHFRRVTFLDTVVDTEVSEGHYHGEMDAANHRSGRGMCTWANGDTYEGEWAMDQPNGAGKLECPDGTRYTGEFQQGQRHGTGTLLQKNGEVYEGTWRMGLRDGRGRCADADGNVYEGEWTHDTQQGVGTCWYTHSAVYSGQWCRGKRHGAGHLRQRDGSTIQGMFNDDELPTYGVYTRPYTRYVGPLQNGVPHGHGTLYVKAPTQQQCPSSSRRLSSTVEAYVGEFEHGELNGIVKEYRAAGTGTGAEPRPTVWVGRYERGSRIGEGSFVREKTAEDDLLPCPTTLLRLLAQRAEGGGAGTSAQSKTTTDPADDAEGDDKHASVASMPSSSSEFGLVISSGGNDGAEQATNPTLPPSTNFV